MSLVLLFWLCIPSFLMVIFSLTSPAIGAVFTSIIIILITALMHRHIFIGKIFIPLIIVAILSVILTTWLIDQPLSIKQVFSLAAIVLLAIAVSTLSHYYFYRPEDSVAKEIKLLCAIFVLIGIMGAFYPVRFGPFSQLNHPVFPFSEPSHYALSYAQVACISLPFFKKMGRWILILFSFFLALALPNTTLLVASTLLLALVVPFSGLVIIIFLLIASAFLLNTSALPESFNYFSSRLTDDSTDNLSRLVYIQGWESLYSAAYTSNGIGIGFQNLGNEAPGETAGIIEMLAGNSLNRADGSFLLAKIGGEFGIIGVISVLALLLTSLYCGHWVRKQLHRTLTNRESILIVPACSVYILIIEILIRGTGYFSPSLLLAIYFLPRAIQILRNGSFGVKNSPQFNNNRMI